MEDPSQKYLSISIILILQILTVILLIFEVKKFNLCKRKKLDFIDTAEL